MQGLPNEWIIDGLEKSWRTLALILDGVAQEEARTRRDGPAGWSVLEVLCHLRDYQAIFAERIRRMLEEDMPRFKPVDEAARLDLAIDNAYASQDLRAVFADYQSTRLAMIDRLKGLDEAQWARPGSFADADIVDVAMAATHTILHDVDHSEQIARVLRA